MSPIMSEAYPEAKECTWPPEIELITPLRGDLERAGQPRLRDAAALTVSEFRGYS